MEGGGVELIFLEGMEVNRTVVGEGRGEKRKENETIDHCLKSMKIRGM